MCCNSRAALSRLAVLWGLLALVTLLVAFVSGSWLYTKEPITLPNSEVTTIITFRIGLWRVCPTIRKVNVSTIRKYKHYITIFIIWFFHIWFELTKQLSSNNFNVMFRLYTYIAEHVSHQFIVHRQVSKSNQY